MVLLPSNIVFSPDIGKGVLMPGAGSIFIFSVEYRSALETAFGFPRH